MYEPPIGQIIAGLAVLVRGFVVAFAAAAFAIGVLSAGRGFRVFRAIFLGEELYETGIPAAIVRVGERSARD